MHLMLDLKTMGTGPNAAIVAIGAATFSKDGVWQAQHLIQINEEYRLGIV